MKIIVDVAVDSYASSVWCVFFDGQGDPSMMLKLVLFC